VKRRAGLFAVILVAQALRAQDKKPWSTGRLCGRLEHVERIPDRKHADNFSETRKALQGVPLIMYVRRENEACCGNLTPIDTAMTGKRGLFSFKEVKPAPYWLEANWNGKEYKVAVVQEPERNSSAICSEQGLKLDYAGNADWWITVTVD
jgi:hypothetical protein